MTYTDEEYEEMAILAIIKYLNKDFTYDEIRSKYSLAMKRMIDKATEYTMANGVKSIQEGDTTVNLGTYVNKFVVDTEIMALLPTPYVKMY
jgi:phage gp16-like protein